MPSTLYLFIHAPEEGVALDVYAGKLIHFHEELEAAQTASGWYGGSVVYRQPCPPNSTVGDQVYCDWYLLSEMARLPDLNAAAVQGDTGTAHAAVVALASSLSQGGVYEFLAGASGLPAACQYSYWFDRVAGIETGEFVQEIVELLEATPDASAWRRQMVLGPHEFVVLSPTQISFPAEWTVDEFSMEEI